MVECIKKEFLKETVENAWKNYKFEDVIIQSVNSVFTKAYTRMITKINRLGETPTFDYSRIGCAGITGSVEIANRSIYNKENELKGPEDLAKSISIAVASLKEAGYDVRIITDRVTYDLKDGGKLPEFFFSLYVAPFNVEEYAGEITTFTRAERCPVVTETTQEEILNALLSDKYQMEKEKEDD